MTLHLNKLVSPLSTDVLCQVCWNCLSSSLEKDRQFGKCIFTTVSLLFHLEKAMTLEKKPWPFIIKKKQPLNWFQPRLICDNFCWNSIWPSGSGEEDSLNFFSVFLLFCYFVIHCRLAKYKVRVVESSVEVKNTYKTNATAKKPQ